MTWQSSPETDDYAIDELMAATLARIFTNDDQACNGMGSFLPVCAFMLARMTHAPDLVWLAGAAGLDPTPERIPASTLEAPLWRSALMYFDVYVDFWNYALNGRWLQIFCVGAAQMDAFGNANNSVIGAFDHPRVRLPGNAGLGEMGSVGTRLIYWTSNHSRRSFVPKNDFISCAGYLTGGDARAQLGMTGGPELVVTDLAVMDFEPVSKRMRLLSTHPGVTLEQVRDSTGFDLLLPEHDLPTTQRPTAEQVRLIRTAIDPDNTRKREFGNRTALAHGTSFRS